MSVYAPHICLSPSYLYTTPSRRSRLSRFAFSYIILRHASCPCDYRLVSFVFDSHSCYIVDLPILLSHRSKAQPPVIRLIIIYMYTHTYTHARAHTRIYPISLCQRNDRFSGRLGSDFLFLRENMRGSNAFLWLLSCYQHCVSLEGLKLKSWWLKVSDWNDLKWLEIKWRAQFWCSWNLIRTERYHSFWHDRISSIFSLRKTNAPHWRKWKSSLMTQKNLLLTGNAVEIKYRMYT